MSDLPQSDKQEQGATPRTDAYIEAHSDVSDRPARYALEGFAMQLERELAAGRGMSLAFIEVKRLAMALEDAEHGHPELIGPIQRMKKREPSGRTKAWRAGIANFHDMQAKRPLKPPGR